MNFKEAVKDTNKALKEMKSISYTGGFSYGFTFIKQGVRDTWSGIKQILVTILCGSVLVFLPIAYPIAIIIRMVKK